MPCSRIRPSSVAKAHDSSRRATEPPLEVMPIYVWSPPAQGTRPPPTMSEDVGRGHFRAEGDKDSLFSNAELAVGAVSSILKDSDLKRSDALSVEEALSLSLQGVISVSSHAFIRSFYRGFMLCIDSILLFGRRLPI